MNKIYKLKYDRRRNQVVAVSELTAGAGKESTGQVAALAGLTDMCSFRKLLGTLTPLAFLTGLVMSLLPGIALANPDLPTGGQIVAGQGSISTNGNQMTISQNTHGLVTNWNTFDVGQNHTVQFVQPDSSAVALNRVTGGHESQILGTLTANGQVMLVNPAGVMFGKGATVNTAGLVASTKNISNADFMAGHYTFSGGSDAGAEVVNQGNLTTTKGGFIVLAADRVKNSGTIITPGGKTVLAAGDKVTLQLDNTGLASVSVSGSVVNALVENSGLLSATDGRVYLTARGKDMLLNTVVNNTGTVEASGLSGHGGEIVLNGGDSGVVKQSGQLLADSHAGPGGKITVEGQNILLAANSRTSATGKTGGGEVYVGGGWQGKDGHIKNASQVVMSQGATIDVSATENGNGGTAVLWSEDYTNFRGTILAKGGIQSGNGGQVETSSRGNLQAFGDVGTSAPAGHGGNWLLDPLNVTIVNVDANTSVSEAGTGTDASLDADTDRVFSPSAAGAQVSAAKISEQLNSGTRVTVDTHGHGEQEGNIIFASDAKINKTGDGDATLTLKADNNIIFADRRYTKPSDQTDGAIVTTEGKLNLNLLTGNNGQVTFGKFVKLFLNNGDVHVGPANESAGKTSVSFTNSGSINAGNIILNAGRGITGKYYTLNAIKDLTVKGPLSVNAGYNITSGIKAGGLLSIIADLGDISFSAPVTSGESAGGKILIEGKDGINIQANNGHLVMNVVDKSQNTINVSSDNGYVALGGKIQDNTVGLSLTNVAITSKDKTTLVGTTFWGSAADLSGLGVTAGGDVDITGNAQNLSNGYLGAAKSTEGLTLKGSNITSTAGNVLLSGLSASKGKASLKVDSSNITADVGKITLSGKTEGLNAATSGVQIADSILSASSLDVKGVATEQGTGFALTNSQLLGRLADLTNVTLSSEGSAAGATNILNLKNGLGYSAFRALQSVGIDNNTSVGIISISAQDMKQYMNFSNTKDWVFDASSMLVSPENGRTGIWGVEGLKGISADTTGIIGLTGFSNLTDSTLKGSSVTLSGADNASLTLRNATLEATKGDVTLTATVDKGDALVLSGGRITSGQGGINLTGTATSGTGSGVSLTDVTMSAESGNIDVNGTGTYAGNGGVYVNGGSFAALNTVLQGTSNINNNGTKLDGHINVTKGDLLVKGTMYHRNNSNFAGILAGDNLNITVSDGKLSMVGQAKVHQDVTDGEVVMPTGNTVGINLKSATLNAGNASLLGSSATSGAGFILDGVTLAGGIENARNMTFSSAGSADGVTNTLNLKGGLGWDSFRAIQNTGIDNNTSVELTAKEGDLANMGFSADDGWTFDSSEAGAAAGEKSGTWGIIFTGISADTKGRVSLRGVNALKDSVLKGSDVSLTSGGGSPLTLQGTSLTASESNVALTSDGRINLSGGSVTASKGRIDIKAGGENGTTGGNALTVNNPTFRSAEGTFLTGKSAQNYSGVKLDGAVNVTTGNLTVDGTSTRENNALNVRGVDARSAKVTLSGADAVLTMTGTVDGDVSRHWRDSVAGLDLDNGNNNPTLMASSAVLKGVNKAGGWGFRLNAQLSGGMEEAADGKLTLSSAGSDATTRNFIGYKTNSDAVKYQIENHANDTGNVTEVTHVDLYKKEFNKFISDNASGNDLNKDFGLWNLTFRNISLDKSGSISIKGASFIDSTLTAGGDLTIDNGAGNLSLRNGNERGKTVLTSKEGGVILKGRAGVIVKKTSITAKNDITLEASNGGVELSGDTISSGSGNITVRGDGTGKLVMSYENSAKIEPREVDGVLLENTSLSALKGKIDLTGRTDGYQATFARGGVRFSRGGALTSASNTVNGNSSRGCSDHGCGGVVVNPGTYNFTGNTVINAVDETNQGLGIYFNSPWGDSFDIKFSSGSHSLNASGGQGVFISPFTRTPVAVNFSVNKGDLNITGNSQRGQGFGTAGIWGESNKGGNKGYVFSGDGNVSVKGTSVNGSGVNVRVLDNRSLTGKFTVVGESKNGAGVEVPEWANINIKDATITGSSQSASGIRINSVARVVNLNNNSLKGISSGSGGLVIRGDNVSLTNGSLSGISEGDGAGVVLAGGSNFTLDGASVTGKSADGAGVDVSGDLTVNNGARIEGTATGKSAAGVKVSGNLNSTGGSGIHGTALSGDGVRVSGDTSLSGVSLSGDTATGTGVNVAGNLKTDEKTTVTGKSTDTGTGVSLGASLEGGKVSGTSADGTGLQLADNATVINSELNGTSTSGEGVSVTGKTILDDTTAQKLHAESGSGNGLSLKDGADINIVHITQSEQPKNDADGKPVTDTSGNPVMETVTTTAPVTVPATLTGTSGSGSGVATSGNVSISGVMLTGAAATEGSTGVTLGGNLTVADAISGVNASATGNGTALKISDGVVDAKGYRDTGKTLVIRATSEEGAAISTSGSSSLISVELGGTASGNGSAVVVSDSLSTDNALTAESKGDKGTALQLSGGHLQSTAADKAPVTVTARATGSGSAVTVKPSAEGKAENSLVNMTMHTTSVQGDALNVGGVLNTKDVVVLAETGAGTALNVRGGEIHSQGETDIIATSDSGHAAVVNNGKLTGDSARALIVTATTTSDNPALSVSGTSDISNSVVSGKNSGSGSAVSIAGNLTSSGAGEIKGQTVNGTAVEVKKGTSATSMQGGGLLITAAASGERGTGVALTSATLTGSQINADAVQGNAVTITDGSITGGNIAGHATGGTGLNISNAVLRENVVSGTTQTGTGAVINGTLTSYAKVMGTASQDGGDGVSLKGSVTGGKVEGHATSGYAVSVADGGSVTDAEVGGDAVSGTGVNIAGKATLTNARLNGTTQTGKGTVIAGNLTADETSVARGKATQDGGDGVSISGNIAGGRVEGHATNGYAVNITGGVSHGVIFGDATLGIGVVASGGSQLTDTTVNGSVTAGTGTFWHAGVEHNNVSVIGNASSGTGVQLDADTTLKNATVSGSTESGKGVDIAGALTSTGRTTVIGTASGTGTGTLLSGDVTGGVVNGHSADGVGLGIDREVTLTDVAVSGTSVSHSGVQVNSHVLNTGSASITGRSDSGAGVSLNGTVSGGVLEGHSVSGPDMYIAGDNNANGVDVSSSSEQGPAVQTDGSPSPAGSKQDTATTQSFRQASYLLQGVISHTDRMKHPGALSGYRAQDKAVDVEICTEEECRKLDVDPLSGPVSP